ncbi:uncharacterized protein FIBRA_06150 [Fibroporia radiculosa]|uniref:Uncharacterized protein n=1 Tax=Fibroporia radiculosa TaxID=599839 RepID=J4H3X3_9APHY|nr:uncharacterized protein FIBRA_06150 [Fibroporia radiculosa]CCM03994.1 predicted protein [Fibroporia radiculosa]
MPKPTLLQSLLGRPSQSYSFPPQKDYHSSRTDLFRAASTSTAGELHPGTASVHSLKPSPPSSVLSQSSARPSSRRVRTLRRASTGSSVSFAPLPEPSRSVIRQPPSPGPSQQRFTSQPHAPSLAPFIIPNQPAPSSDQLSVDFTLVQPAIVAPLAGTVKESLGDHEGDAFYTPSSSLIPSPSATLAPTVMLLEPQALASALLPLRDPMDLKVPVVSTESQDVYDTDISITPGPLSRFPSELDSASVSRTASDSSLSSYSGVSISISEQDATSLFDSGATTSTRITTPATSDRDPPKSDEDVVEAITILSSSSTRKSRLHAANLSPSSVEASSSEPIIRRRSQPLPAPRPDEDWAKDVRWLVPTSLSAAPVPRPKSTRSPTSSRRRSRPLHPDLLPPAPQLAILPPPHQLDRQSFPDIPTFTMPVAVPRPVRTRSKEPRSSRHSHRQSRGRMSALWEEDESEYSTDAGASSAEVSRASTPALTHSGDGSAPASFNASRSDTPPPGWASSASAHMGPGIADSLESLQLIASMSESELITQRRMDSPPSSPVDSSPDAKLQNYALQRQHFHSSSTSTVPVSGSPLSAPGRTTSPLVGVMAGNNSFPTYSIPAPFPDSDGSPNTGYTGLVLPRASYTSKDGKPLADGRIDLVRSGRAQTSMATIEVVQGAAAFSPLTKTRSRLTRSFSLSIGKDRRKSQRDSVTPPHLRGTMPLSVAFTAHIPPPSFVPPSHILVQVFAVGLDGLDSLIVQERAAQRGAGGSVGRTKNRGFIPGRSFVGKAVECGFEVSREVCKKGEWVIGLQDVKKCGALAEFVLIERHRVFRSPQPRARSTNLFPPRRRGHGHTRSLSLPSAIASGSATHQPHAPSPLAPPAPLTLEELALLPLCGVSAHRAVRSFADILAYRSGKGRDRPHVLVLMGHDGPGAMAVQMIGRRTAHICVQVPESAVREPEAQTDSSEDSVKPSGSIALQRVEARIRAWGAEEVCVGEALGVLERLADEGRGFDAILDTVGGVHIWEASQRLLAFVPSMAASQSAPTLSTMFAPSEDSPDGETEEKKSKGGSSYAQFTTLVGDVPSRAVPKAQDNLRSGLRSLRRAMSTSSPSKASGSAGRTLSSGRKKTKRTVGYAWVSVAADVDDEGEDVRDALGTVVEMVEDGTIRPWMGHDDDGEERSFPLESAPEVFRRDANGPKGVLVDGGTCVVRIGA